MTQASNGLDEMIFYAIDKASPYALAMHEENNSLEKIMDFSLAQLSIVAPGNALMWLWIDAHSAPFGAKPVSMTTKAKAITVEQVVTAVRATVTAS